MKPKTEMSVCIEKINSKVMVNMRKTHREIAMEILTLEKQLAEIKDHCEKCGTTEFLCGHNARE